MLFLACFGIGACAFLLLIALMVVRQRPRSFGLGVLLACVATLLWAVAAAFQTWLGAGIAHVLESTCFAGWLLTAATVLAAARRRHDKWTARHSLILIVTAAVGAAGIVGDFYLAITHPGPALTAAQILYRIAVAVYGILLVENLFRNTSAGRRWHVVPFCIGLGALFAYNLFVYCSAVALKRLDPSLLAGQGVILALSVPLLLLTMARNPEWDIDVHVSRGAVFHGVTFTATGLFLLVAGGVAGVLGRISGQWATVAELSLFCGSVVLLLAVLSTESFRSRVKRIIAENFFSMRYDYRAEWLRSIATLSSSHTEDPLLSRAIRAIADVVDSPGGALWLQNSGGDYGVVHQLNMSLSPTAHESVAGKFVTGFKDGASVQEITNKTARSGNGPEQPVWALGTAAWIAVPLMRQSRMIGFVVLARPRAPTMLSWESFELLLTIGQQVAGYLAEESATRTLLESRVLIDYSKNFAFVIHDVKNVAGQLALMIANFPKYGEQAEFRSDMLRGMEGSVKKLRELISRLRPGAISIEHPGTINPADVIRDVAQEFCDCEVNVIAEIAPGTIRVRISSSTLKTVLAHLVRNAKEASAVGRSVVVRLRPENGKACIDVVDSGCGMSADFVRDGLFAPLLSTKQGGHGIGAYQARELVRAAGGDLTVSSILDKGTTMRIVLPESRTEQAEQHVDRTAAE